jgi:hypothetical protein
MHSLMIRKISFTLVMLMTSLFSIDNLIAKTASSRDIINFSQVTDFKKHNTAEQWFAWKVALVEGQSKICCANNYQTHSNYSKLSCT